VAKKLLQSNFGLTITDGKLSIDHRETQKQFQALLDQAKSLRTSLKPAYAKALRVVNTENITGLGLLIKPIPESKSTKGDSHPAIAIFISDPRQPREQSAQLLSELFNLTPAEANLALQLANGLTLDEASTELGISRNTAKTQLSSVFSKTGVTRQTNLVQLILKSVAPIG
jgi:DNA-binding CsgD family transcriptional regulator